jgi:hypothetical protein
VNGDFKFRAGDIKFQLGGGHKAIGMSNKFFMNRVAMKELMIIFWVFTIFLLTAVSAR